MITKKLIEKSIFQIIDPNYGTGFFIDNEGRFITCKHVISGDIKKIKTNKYNFVDIEKSNNIEKENNIDIFVGKIKNFKSTEYLEIENSYKLKDTIFLFGYPSNKPAIEFHCLLSSILKLDRFQLNIENYNYISDIQIEDKIKGGYSGGPCLNYEGKVIGVNTSSGKKGLVTSFKNIKIPFK